MAPQWLNIQLLLKPRYYIFNKTEWNDVQWGLSRKSEAVIQGNILQLIVNSLRPSDTYMCHSAVPVNYAIIGSDNGLLPCWHKATVWSNVGILFIGPLGTNFTEISITINISSFKKMHLKMSSVKWWPRCLNLNLLMISLPSWSQ